MTSRITTNDELAALLNTLGDTADVIAEKLRAQGIKGTPGQSNRCPIANWLKREVQDANYAEVGGTDGDEVTIIVDEQFLWCVTTDGVDDFVDIFDGKRAYIDLIGDEAQADAS